MPDETTPLSDDERADLLDLYDGLRVTDVTDGLDFHGYGYELNKMSSDIQPLYRDIESFAHRFVGFAHTVRFLPTNRRRELPDELGFESVASWRNQWYGERSGGPSDVRDGDVIVVEAHDLPVGIIGSMNSLDWVANGAVAVVTNGGPRDTDEIIKQDTPIYAPTVNKTIIPGRCEFDGSQIPISVGGCLVRPDDVLVGDGDGIVVVPQEVAWEVGEAARQEQADDQAARRDAYERAGLEPDFTLE